jgi:hypothetical protein
MIMISVPLIMHGKVKPEAIKHDDISQQRESASSKSFVAVCKRAV